MKGLIINQIIEDWQNRPTVLFAEAVAMILSLGSMILLSVMGNQAPAEWILGLWALGSLGFIYSAMKRSLMIPLLMSVSYFAIELAGFIKAICE